MGTPINHTLNFLRQNYYPFIHLSDSALSEAETAIRTFELKTKERIKITGSHSQDYLYITKGSVEIEKRGKYTKLDAKHINPNPFLFLRQPESLIITALEDATVCHANSDALDYLVSWEGLVQESDSFDDEASKDNLKKVRDAVAFRRLPMEAVEEAFRRMEKVSINAGQNVVTQGEPGEAFYVIIKGEAEVWQQGLYDDEQKKVAVLNEGDTFGEEALVLGATRNATVKMITDGELLTLKKDDFNELMSAPMIRKVTAEVAKAMINNGYHLLDVRYEEEFDDRSVPGAQLIPLPELRSRCNELDMNRRYLIMCASGRRATVASLLLRQRNFDVSVIEGGMRDWPYETQSSYD